MVKKTWRRDPNTGLPIGRDPTTGIPSGQLPDRYQTDAGYFDRSQFSDCDLFTLRAIVAAAGFPNVYDFKRRALAPCSSYFHLHKIRSGEALDPEGRVLGYATHTDSATWGGGKYRAAAKARQLAGRRIEWDVSSGSVR